LTFNLLEGLPLRGHFLEAGYGVDNVDKNDRAGSPTLEQLQPAQEKGVMSW
jgi:hypothetical protein